MKEPTKKEMQELVDFQRSLHGTLYVHTVKCNVAANIEGSVWGDVKGEVGGTINGRKWQFVETPKEKVIRLIREGKCEEAIKVLEENEQ